MSSDKPQALFTAFEDRVLTHPKSDPAVLVKNLQSTCQTMACPRAVAAAHACLDQKAWKHLAAMSIVGFDLSANHCLEPENENARVKETLIHRAIRVAPYDQLAHIVEKLVEIGCDPKTFNAQGASPLGVMCHRARDMPVHRTKEVFAALAMGGVRMSDPIINGQGIGHWLFHTKSAPDYLRLQDPEIAGWAQSIAELESLEENTLPSPGSGRQIPRL